MNDKLFLSFSHCKQHFKTGITAVWTTFRSESCPTREGRYSPCFQQLFMNEYHDGYLRQNTSSFSHQAASQVFCAQHLVRQGFDSTSQILRRRTLLGAWWDISNHFHEPHATTSLHDSTRTKRIPATGRLSHSSVAANVSRIHQIFVKDNDLSVGATDFFSVT